VYSRKIPKIKKKIISRLFVSIFFHILCTISIIGTGVSLDTKSAVIMNISCYSAFYVHLFFLYLMLRSLFMQQFYWISVPLFDLDHYMFRPLHKAIFRWMFCGPCHLFYRIVDY
jgi:hypothetical protein